MGSGSSLLEQNNLTHEEKTKIVSSLKSAYETNGNQDELQLFQSLKV